MAAPVEPDLAFTDFPQADLIVMLDFWLEPDEDFKGRYPELMAWLRSAYRQGASLYAACSGSVMLAETGLLDGCEATSHWGYMDLFRKRYPQVRFRPEPALVFADRAGRIATAGGVTSWHDLAIHIISRHCSPGEALRIAKVYLLKWHGEGQLPYASLVRRQPHADSVVRLCEDWLARHFREADAIAEGAEYGYGEGAKISQRRVFELLWNTLHTKPGETWEANPWVVAVTFAVHNANIDRREP